MSTHSKDIEGTLQSAVDSVTNLLRQSEKTPKEVQQAQSFLVKETRRSHFWTDLENVSSDLRTGHYSKYTQQLVYRRLAQTAQKFRKELANLQWTLGYLISKVDSELFSTTMVKIESAKLSLDLRITDIYSNHLM